MELRTLQFLLSRDGEELLETAAKLDGTFLQKVTKLRKKRPPDVSAAALELLDLRKRASKKFRLADRMFFTREALEQSSGEAISSYRAERFERDSRILDLACGIGGDTISLAERCFITAVDNDPVKLEMARRNVEVYGFADRVTFVCADVTEFTLDADAAFLDPSRRSEGRRVTNLADLSPPEEFIRRLTREIPNCAIKLSPAIKDQEAESFGGEVEFISESGECKEAVIWCGNFKSAERRATILPSRTTMTKCDKPEITAKEPGKYLYEPDPCMIRAHFVEQIAEEIGAWKIDDEIAYLSSDVLTKSPYAAAFHIIESLPFNLKAVNKRLNALGVGKIIIKKRGVPFEPMEIERRLKLKGNIELILALTRVFDKPYALICERID